MRKSKFEQVALPVIIVVLITFVIMLFVTPSKGTQNQNEDQAEYNGELNEDSEEESNEYIEESNTTSKKSFTVCGEDISENVYEIESEDAPNITSVRVAEFGDEEGKKPSTVELDKLSYFKNLESITLSPGEAIASGYVSHYGLYQYQINLGSLEKRTKIKELCIHSMDVRSLSFLENSEIEMIKFVDCEFSKLKEAEYEKLKKITSLSLGGQCSDVNLEKALASMPKLKKIELGDTEILDYNLFRYLKNPAKLESVSVSIYSINRQFLETILKPIPCLKSLSVQFSINEELSKENTYELPFLANYKSLESLTIIGDKDLGYQGADVRVYPMDYSYLSSLTSLKSLTLKRACLKDISFLSSLTNLSKLDISNNLIADISQLQTLTKLEQLDISCNDIETIEPIGGLVDLKSLSIGNNKIASIEPLKNMIKLESFDASSGFYRLNDPAYAAENIIAGYYGVEMMQARSSDSGESGYNPRRLEDLEKLNAYLCQEKDVDTMDDMSPFFFAYSNDGSYVTLCDYTRKCPWLKNQNTIEDLSPIANATNMKFLDVSGNQIKDIDVVKNMTKLQFLSCMQNQIRDISFLSRKEFPNLSYLFVSQNKIADAEILEVLRNTADDYVKVQYYMTPYYNKQYFELVEPKEPVFHVELMGLDVTKLFKNMGTQEE